MEKKIKCVWKHSRPHIAKIILRKKSKTGSNMFPDLKLYFKATAIKTVWYWHKNRYIDQCKRTESPEMNPHVCGQLLYDRWGRNIQWEKTASSKSGVWKIGQLHAKDSSSCILQCLDIFLTPYIKVN